MKLYFLAVAKTIEEHQQKRVRTNIYYALKI